MSGRRDFLAFTAGAVAARTVLPIVARAAPAIADRDEMLTRYDAWLDSERLALMQELYPGCDPFEARRFIPCTAFVTHWGKWRPPSPRALAVLEAAGIYTGPDTEEARRTVWGAAT